MIVDANAVDNYCMLRAAKALGFQMSPPAYRSLPMPSPTTMEGFTGVNYASANAGIRESTVSKQKTEIMLHCKMDHNTNY